MTGRITRIVQAAARPAIFVQYVALRAGLRGTVFPRDAGSGVVSGDDPQRVLVIGEATAVGFGVLSHELGMAGHFSRQLSRRTGRGVEWATRPFSDLTIHTAAGTVRDRALLDGVDVVLLMVGVGDSIRLTPQRTWRRLLCAALEDLARGLPAGARGCSTASRTRSSRPAPRSSPSPSPARASSTWAIRTPRRPPASTPRGRAPSSTGCSGPGGPPRRDRRLNVPCAFLGCRIPGRAPA
jgi:hypothetical protein